MTTDNNPKTHAFGWPDDISDDDLARMVRAGVADGERMRSGALGDFFLAAGRGVARLYRALTQAGRKSPVAHPTPR